MKLPKTYEAGKYEKDIYRLWENNGAFIAEPSSGKERFSISMPPPNETGTLSLGHALFLTLQDIAARYQRQKGKDVLWLPGTDHAALAVNAIIEKKLAEEGTDKHAIGREAFLKKTREFVAGSRDIMLEQMRAMGSSADWSRLRYTLDDALSRCVNETFIRMYQDGLIYRGHRIVNWDPNLGTTVSDDEVERKEETTSLYTFQYGPFKISTARPETKFGDKYVVMHPDDKRYAKYKHGDTFEAEWINGPVTATVIKDAAVDPGFGTGVMTITPWHDHTDFEIAERHNLDKEQVIDFEGKLLSIAGEFSGMPIAEARPLIVSKLAAKGLLVHTDENYVHSVAINERGKGIIEPQIRLQWFVDVNKKAVSWKGKTLSLKQVMQSVVHDGDIKLMPKRFEKTYFHWIDNLRDWCISRQIWWGHRIPVWYRDSNNTEEIYVGLTEPKGEGWEQDHDTLDTWFSSALWTWSTLIDSDLAKDPSVTMAELFKKSIDYQTYHPTSFMETGWDILFFWVARMILATTYMTGEVPFKTVYLHGLIRAADGKKMSKSRPESIIDPLHVIPQYGTDALRMALIMGVSPGNDQNWSWGKIEANRNFCNKIWNIARYVEGVVGEDFRPVNNPEAKTMADEWVLSKLQHGSKAISSMLENYKFSEAYDTLYHLIWDDIADWYIEASKSGLNKPLLAYTLETILKLAHPFAPFVTETIWQTLGWQKGSLLMLLPWPEVQHPKTSAAKDFESLRLLIQEIRQISNNLQLQKPVLLHAESKLLSSNGELIQKLAKLADVRSVSEGSGLQLLNAPDASAWLDIDKKTASSHKHKLEQTLSEQKLSADRLKQRLANKGYVASAPEHIVQQTRDQLTEAKQSIVRLEEELASFTEAAKAL